MESSKSRVILQNHTTSFNWGHLGREPEDHRHSAVILFNSNVDYAPFKFNPSETSIVDIGDPDILSSIQQVVNAPESGSYIELISKYDTRNLSGTQWTSTKFTNNFLTKLCDLLPEPTISVQCTFSNNTVFKSTTQLADAKSSQINKSASKAINGFIGNTLTYTICLEWKQPYFKRNRCNVLEKLFHSKKYADCCIVTGDETEIKCHAFVLAENSDVFNAMLTNGLEESQTKRIEMEDLSDSVVNLLLPYLYGIKINPFKLSGDLAFELLRAAHKYNISSLEEDMMDTLLKKPASCFPVDVVLKIYFFTVNVDQFNALCDKTLDILRKNSKDLIASPTYQDILDKEPKEAAKLALKLLELGSN